MLHTECDKDRSDCEQRARQKEDTGRESGGGGGRGGGGDEPASQPPPPLPPSTTPSLSVAVLKFNKRGFDSLNTPPPPPLYPPTPQPPPPPPSHRLVVKGSASGAEDPGFDTLLRRDFPSKVALQWLPCQAPGIIGSALGLVGPVSVYCDWVR